MAVDVLPNGFYDGYDEENFDEIEKRLNFLDQRIEELQRINPAFEQAPEIFLVSSAKGEFDRLIAIWCTDWTPR